MPMPQGTSSRRKCEDRALKQPIVGLPAEGRARWCGCAKAHAGAQNLAIRKCEDCALKWPSFGLPGRNGCQRQWPVPWHGLMLVGAGTACTSARTLKHRMHPPSTSVSRNGNSWELAGPRGKPCLQLARDAREHTYTLNSLFKIFRFRAPTLGAKLGVCCKIFAFRQWSFITCFTHVRPYYAPKHRTWALGIGYIFRLQFHFSCTKKSLEYHVIIISLTVDILLLPKTRFFLLLD